MDGWAREPEEPLHGVEPPEGTHHVLEGRLGATKTIRKLGSLKQSVRKKNEFAQDGNLSPIMIPPGVLGFVVVAGPARGGEVVVGGGKAIAQRMQAGKYSILHAEK